MLTFLPTNILAVVGILMGNFTINFVEWNGLWFFAHGFGLIVSQWLRARLESVMLKFFLAFPRFSAYYACFLCFRFLHCAVNFFSVGKVLFMA